jgi:hypothetical protein
VIKLPKRKLRLWYSKEDYKKEREEELAKQGQPQNESLTQPPVGDENTASTAVDNSIQPVENEAKVALVEGGVQQPREENEKQEMSLGAEGNLPSEIPAAITENQQEPGENQTQPEPAIAHEPVTPQIETNELAPPLKIETEKAPVQTDQTATPVESEVPTSPTQTEPTASVENAAQQVQTDGTVSLLEAPKPAEPELIQAPVETETAVEALKEEEPETEIKVPLTDSVQSIEKYTDSLKALLPTKAVVCVGEYPINIRLKSAYSSKKDVLNIFIEKSTKDVIKWSQGQLDKNSIVCLDEDIDTHFWFDILPYFAGNESFFAKIKSKPLDKLQGAIIISSTWNGIGSALLPTLNSHFNEWNVNSLALAILPSKAQPLDGQFNTCAAIGILASKDSTTAILVDRDNIEDFTGIDRNGFAINGNTITNYLLDLMLAKETFARELSELSKSFNTKMFSVLFAPGVSWKLYGSLENILNTTLVRPLFSFDLSTSTLLYVLIRMPFSLKDKLPRGKIELAVANWFKNKADLESIYIADPVYVEDSSDRIDIAMFVGGFNTSTRFAELEKRVEKMKNKVVKKGSITEEDWQSITKSFVE